MTNPTLLILDEATEGLAPIIRSEIWRCVGALKAQGQSILLIDKNLNVLKRIADYTTLLKKAVRSGAVTAKRLGAKRNSCIATSACDVPLNPVRGNERWVRKTSSTFLITGYRATAFPRIRYEIACGAPFDESKS